MIDVLYPFQRFLLVGCSSEKSTKQETLKLAELREDFPRILHTTEVKFLLNFSFNIFCNLEVSISSWADFVVP